MCTRHFVLLCILEFVQDFVDEVETQRNTFSDMHEYGQATVIRFLPSEKLQETVSSLLHLWEEFVGDMSTRWDRIVSIQVRLCCNECCML